VLVALTEGFHFGGLYVLAMAACGIALAVGIAALSHAGERAFSTSVVYLGLGAIGAVALHLLNVTPLDPIDDAPEFERLTELALIVAVFAGGLTIEANVRRRSIVSVAVLLIVVMPLTIAAVAAFGYYAIGLSFGAALLLGTILAPTDPVLAGDVGLGPPGSDPEGEPRFSLHTEAAINDGLASPFVLLGIFVAVEGGTGWIGEWILADVLYAGGVALLLGAAAGAGAAWCTTKLRAGGFMDADLDAFAALALILLTYGLSELLGAYGLLALFAAGFAFRRYEYEHEIHEGIHTGAHTAETLLELAVLLVLGSMLTLDGLGNPGWTGWLLAPLLLLVIRPALVLATSGPGLASWRERFFLGFFGTRGVAALFYAAIVAESGALSIEETRVVVWTVVACVVVSIVVHGISATPLTKRLLDR